MSDCILNENTYIIILYIIFRGVNPGGLVVATPDFGQGGREEVVGGVRGRVVKYYYILSCTGSVFESGDF